MSNMSLGEGYAYLLVKTRKEEDEGDGGELLKLGKALEILARTLAWWWKEEKE